MQMRLETLFRDSFVNLSLWRDNECGILCCKNADATS